MAHIGPIEGTALHNAIYRLTKSASVGLAAALEEWAAWRFDGLIPPNSFLSQADAARAWTIDCRYMQHGKEDEIKEPPARSAMSMVAELTWDAVRDEFWKFPSTPPQHEVHLAFLVRHVMPKEKRKPFETWTKWALGRLAEISPRPDEPIGPFEDYESEAAYDAAQRPYFGAPIPQEALDPDFDYKPEMREDLLDRYLQSLDWKQNPFLRSPDEMKELGFEGTPYRLK